MSGTDLTCLNDISIFVSQIDGDLGLVQVDTKIKHGGLRGLKWVGRKTDFSLRETSMRFLMRYITNRITWQMLPIQ